MPESKYCKYLTQSFSLLFISDRYVQLLKDDEQLRVEMGRNARSSVKEQTVQHVTEDLISWYQLGMKKKQNKPLGKLLVSFLLMLFFVPVSILSFFVYDILVSDVLFYSMIVLIYYI